MSDRGGRRPLAAALLPAALAAGLAALAVRAARDIALGILLVLYAALAA